MQEMAKETLHISESEALNDLRSLLERVTAGAEIVIERNSLPLAVLRPPERTTRLLSESIALAETHAQEQGHEPVMDADFAADVREIIENRKPRRR